MSMTTFDAREVMIPGSIYDRSSGMNGSAGQTFFRPHDPLSYLTGDRGGQGFPSLPVPIGMFMTAPVPGNYYQTRQQQPLPPNTRNNRRGGRKQQNSQSSQETGGHSLSDAPLTQTGLSMSQVSQNPYPGFSQPLLSQSDMSQVCLSFFL